MSIIIKNTKGTVFEGCDFVVGLPKERENNVKILQITDTELMDAAQMRNADALTASEQAEYARKNVYIN